MFDALIVGLTMPDVLRLLQDAARGIAVDYDVWRILQAVAQDDGVLPPANLYGQLLGVIVNLVVAFGGAVAYHITQKTARAREAVHLAREKAAQVERDRLAREVRETAERIARDLAEKVERERVAIAEVVRAELDKARIIVEEQAHQTESAVRHDVNSQLTKAQIQIQQLQRQIAERVDAKLDAHGAKFDAAYSEANRTTEKFADLRKDFNAILEREGKRDEQNQRDGEQADRIEETGDDTNLRVREGLTPDESARLRRGLEKDGR